MCTCVTMSLGKGTGVQTTLVINMLCCFVLFMINNQIFVSTFFTCFVDCSGCFTINCDILVLNIVHV